MPTDDALLAFLGAYLDHARHLMAFHTTGNWLAMEGNGLFHTGVLFPEFKAIGAGHRATEFKRICGRANVSGVTLHSYRYAWAERAKVCGYPERFAQEALGHNSKAVHRAYARKAKVKLPSLETYEKRSREAEVIPMPIPDGNCGLPVASRGSNGEQQNGIQAVGA